MAKGKRRAQFKHARRRAAERMGIHLHQDLVAKIVEEIQAGRCQIVEKQSRRVSVFAVVAEGQAMHAVYDRKTKMIVTFLYPDGKPRWPLPENGGGNGTR